MRACAWCLLSCLTAADTGYVMDDSTIRTAVAAWLADEPERRAFGRELARFYETREARRVFRDGLPAGALAGDCAQFCGSKAIIIFIVFGPSAPFENHMALPRAPASAYIYPFRFPLLTGSTSAVDGAVPYVA